MSTEKKSLPPPDPQTPTPRTDAHIAFLERVSGGKARYINPDFAREIERDLSLASAKLEQMEKALVIWKDGYPPHPYDKEWFLAHTKFGDRVVLTALPEEFSYDFKTSDETYMKKENVIKWAQFPTSEFRTPLEDAQKEIAELRAALASSLNTEKKP